ncbi:LMX1B factor, partial [Spizella passerina]|nr:LMX1B factor [Spizella passerina]
IPAVRRLFPRRCSRCLGALGRSERVLRVLGRVFHERCLRCGSCGRRLRSGDEFVLRDGRILCRGHAEPEPEPGAASPAVEDGARSEDEEGRDSRCSRNSGGKDPKRSKRPRTILSSQQRRAFKASFEVSSKPCRKVPERSGTCWEWAGNGPGLIRDYFGILGWGSGIGIGDWNYKGIFPRSRSPSRNSEGFFPIPGLLPGIPRDFSPFPVSFLEFRG